MTWLAMLLSAVIAQSAGAPAAQMSAPTRISELDTGKLKGEPTQLAWSADGTKLFLQTSERDSRGMVTKPRFYVMSASEGKPESLSAAPEWAGEYWAWKGSKTAPGAGTVAIDIKNEERTSTSTGAPPMGGALARGDPSGDPTGGTSVDEATRHASEIQKQHVITLTFKGQTVGEFVNQQFLPGYTFSWSPQGALIAYANTAGRLTLMDAQGQRQEAASTKNVILPAWSPDGARIVFLQRTGKTKYDLCVVDVKQP